MEFSRFVRERVQYLRRNNEMSDSVLRYMEKKRSPFGKEIDYKLLFLIESSSQRSGQVPKQGCSEPDIQYTTSVTSVLGSLTNTPGVQSP